jgi:hypothetical protein
VDGTIDRVGADHLDVAVHAPGSQRREAYIRAVEVIPLTAVLAVFT